VLHSVWRSREIDIADILHCPRCAPLARSKESSIESSGDASKEKSEAALVALEGEWFEQLEVRDVDETDEHFLACLPDVIAATVKSLGTAVMSDKLKVPVAHHHLIAWRRS
jgi:hypothetical protein